MYMSENIKLAWSHTWPNFKPGSYNVIKTYSDTFLEFKLASFSSLTYTESSNSFWLAEVAYVAVVIPRLSDTICINTHFISLHE